MDYIIVQAGGEGRRLEHLTRNRPKALLPVKNQPLLFRLFQKFPNKKFIIIADYKRDVMREYLECFASVEYYVIDANGKGTCSGIKQAIDLIPRNTPFTLIWCDLALPDDFSLPEQPSCDCIGISETFTCRWSFNNGHFAESPSTEHGVAGFFIFTDKDKISNVPESGEFVRYLSQSNIFFREISLRNTIEFGLLKEYNQLEKIKCRPFNKITITNDIVIKEGLDEQGLRLAIRERNWYEKAKEYKIGILPKIYSTNPLTMERIHGKNIYECHLPYNEKKDILEKLISSLKLLHSKESIPANPFSMKNNYYTKTIERIKPVRDLIPFANDPEIVINGKRCRNVFFHKLELERKLEKLHCDQFCFIHGDPTFSNMMIRESGEPVLIDPRGYFGFTEYYGDPMYDWGKLYYSIVGNYDQFNLKNFNLSINESDVELSIDSNGWEDMEDDFFCLTGANVDSIKLIHAVIWLSLTTYAWQDYDSVCGAFYNGLFYLEDVL